jgi:hypothetical protein
LILASGGIGDNILFSTVVNRFSAMAEPDELVTVLIRQDATGSTFLFPPGIAIETYDWKRFRRNLFYRWALCAKMRRKNLRLVISTDYERHPFVDEIIIAACGTCAWAETARPSRKYEQFHRRNAGYFDSLVETPSPSHRLMHWINLANALTGQDQGLPDFSSKPCHGKTTGETVVLHPFSSDRRRELPVDVFETIIKEIPTRYRRLLSCTKDDLDRHPEWRDRLEKFGVSVDMSTLQSKYETLKTAALLISVDTSLVHLGMLAGTKTICLCTDAYRGWSVPYDASFAPDHVRFHTSPCEQNGCLGHCPHPLENGTFRCLARLPLHLVLKDIRKETKGL